MESFGIFSLKAGIILLLFWGIYRLFLQKETFYSFNRLFLMAGLVASFLLPLYTFHYTAEIKTPGIPVNLITDSENISPAASTGAGIVYAFLNSFIPILYIVVLLTIMTYRIISLSRLFKVIHRSCKKRFSGYNLIESSEFDGAFSFFHFAFIPKSLNESEKNIILRHEETHIAQNHWIDLLLTNILSLIWWFNPIIWLYGKAIRNNHEYLADNEVLSSYEQADYQQTLVNQWLKTPVFPIANSFSYSNRLKRIKMMKKSISNPARRLFSLVAIPAIAVFFLAFSKPEYKYSHTETTSDSTQKDSTIYALVTHENLEAIKNGSDSILHLQNPVMIEKKSKGLRLRATGDMGLEKEPLIIIDGKKEPVDLSEINPDEILSISVLKDKSANEIYGEEGQNGVVLITTKAGQKAVFESSSYDIRGSVVDKSGNPIRKALIKITEKETYSDINGMFSLKIAPGDWLSIEVEGYEKKNIRTDENVRLNSVQIILQKTEDK